MKKLNVKVILQIIGTFLMLEAVAMALCLIASFWYGEDPRPIIYASVITAAVGATFNLSFKNCNKDIGKREGYFIVSIVWVVFSLFGCLPFIISGSIPSLADAFFETMSGFTTTGASILNDIESVPKGLLLWRSTTQWLGGMGIIVLSLAILPILGIGGMQLYAAEVPGPTKDKIHPKVKDTAQRLYAIYVLFTLLETGLLMLGEMSFYDAINHSLTTMATGGFSVYNTSLVEATPYIQYIVTLFMFIAGVNFTLSYFALHGRFKLVWMNEEFRYYLFITLAFVGLIFGTLVLHTFRFSPENLNLVYLEQTFRDTIFQVVTLCTTTGFATADYLTWTPLVVALCFMLMFFGGSAGSTSGGMKTVRIVLLAKHAYLEFKRLIHPNAIIPLRLSNNVVSQKIITNVLAFIVIFMIVFVLGVLIMSGLNYDLETSMGAVIACLGNIGPGIGKVGPMDNFSFFCDTGKWFLSFLMLCGRLELFTVLILFSPDFWRK